MPCKKHAHGTPAEPHHTRKHAGTRQVLFPASCEHGTHSPDKAPEIFGPPTEHSLSHNRHIAQRGASLAETNNSLLSLLLYFLYFFHPQDASVVIVSNRFLQKIVKIGKIVTL